MPRSARLRYTAPDCHRPLPRMAKRPHDENDDENLAKRLHDDNDEVDHHPVFDYSCYGCMMSLMDKKFRLLENAESMPEFIFLPQSDVDFCDGMLTIDKPAHDHRVCFRMHSAAQGDEVPLLQTFLAEEILRDGEPDAKKPEPKLDDVLLISPPPKKPQEYELYKPEFSYDAAYPSITRPARPDSTWSMAAYMLERFELSAPQTVYTEV